MSEKQRDEQGVDELALAMKANLAEKRREALAEALRQLEKARPFWNGPVWEAVFIIDAALGQKGAHQPGQDLEESGADALRRIAHESVKRGQENAALRALAGEMREALKRVEHVASDDYPSFCPECEAHGWVEPGHEPGCDLAAALAKADELLGGE